jgi:hypothetical protein
MSIPYYIPLLPHALLSSCSTTPRCEGPGERGKRLEPIVMHYRPDTSCESLESLSIRTPAMSPTVVSDSISPMISSPF